MTNEIFWRYKFDYSLHALEVWVHEAGRLIREWAGCQNFRFGPERENLFLLTSPFIEQIPRISDMGGSASRCPSDGLSGGREFRSLQPLRSSLGAEGPPIHASSSFVEFVLIRGLLLFASTRIASCRFLRKCQRISDALR